MQWYLASLLMLLVLTGVGLLTGCLVLAWLPWRMRPGAREFLSVPLGWAVLTLVATVLGWIGPGYARCHCALVTAGIAAAGAWVGRRWLRRAGGTCARLVAFCVMGSLPTLAPLGRIGVFNLYTDAFHYHCQAQWLQAHPFVETARTVGGHPAWQSVVFMQENHLRMGAAFLLGWVQAMFGLELSLDAFPAVMSLAVVCGALGVGATVLAACPGRRAEAWLAALAVAGTVNGFGAGAANGYLPQTWGLALCAAVFGLRGLELGTRAQRSGCAPWCAGVPVGVCAAAAMYCYWDLLPLAGPALIGSYLLPWPGRDARRWRTAWERARAPLLTCVALVNLEWGRAARGIPLNIRTVTANPVAWPPWHFPAHAFGLKSSVLERSQWINHSAPLGFLLAGCLAVGAWLVFLAFTRTPGARWRRPTTGPGGWRWQPLTPALIWMALTVALFVYFRYAVNSPWHGQNDKLWPDGVGQSWSQYKVTIWSSAFVIGLAVAVGTGLVTRLRSPLARGLFVALLAVWCGTGSGWNFFLAKRRGDMVLAHSGDRRDPLAACRAMRGLAGTLPAGDWIYLDWAVDGATDKYRELMTYFLCDRPLASDWVNSPFHAAAVAPEDAGRTRADCRWVLRYRRPGGNDEGRPPAPGGMTLERAVP